MEKSRELSLIYPYYPSLSGALSTVLSKAQMGWLGVAMVLGKLPVPGRPTIWMIVGQGPTVLAVGAGGGCSDIFILLYLFSLFLPLSGRWPDID